MLCPCFFLMVVTGTPGCCVCLDPARIQIHMTTLMVLWEILPLGLLLEAQLLLDFLGQEEGVPAAAALVLVEQLLVEQLLVHRWQMAQKLECTTVRGLVKQEMAKRTTWMTGVRSKLWRGWLVLASSRAQTIASLCQRFVCTCNALIGGGGFFVCVLFFSRGERVILS